MYVSDDNLNKACASTDGKELSTATDPSVLKASLTIMREGVLSNKYSESDQVGTTRMPNHSSISASHYSLHIPV